MNLSSLVICPSLILVLPCCVAGATRCSNGRWKHRSRLAASPVRRPDNARAGLGNVVGLGNIAAGLILLIGVATSSGCRPVASTSSSAIVPVPLTTASGLEMVYLPGGTFSMGSESGEPDERPLHSVTIGPFAIDSVEVTHAMFQQVQLPNPSKWQDDPRNPVNQIRWREAKVYCNERSLAEGLEPCYDESQPGWPCDYAKNGYRLPTEAEWEYAARCGEPGDYGFGAPSKLKQFAWYRDNSGGRAHPVGTRKANPWGIHDMYGNLSEWCQDAYDPTYYASSPTLDPRGPATTQSDAKRVVRGGSWKKTDGMCRVSFRQGKTTGDSDACFTSDDCGFRCVRRVTPEELAQRKTAPAG